LIEEGERLVCGQKRGEGKQGRIDNKDNADGSEGKRKGSASKKKGES